MQQKFSRNMKIVQAQWCIASVILVVSLFQTGACFVSISTETKYVWQDSALAAASAAASEASPLKIAIVGGGPSGLLLAHLLLQDDSNSVTLLEGREDPRQKDTEQRAYALGLGIRGRTAIREVDEKLWEAVKARGYESERFQLHVAGFVLPLRSEKDGGKGVEPSVLTYQSELCAGLVEELENRHNDSNRLHLKFGTSVERCDLSEMKIATRCEDGNDCLHFESKFDLIVGCDGVNSVVRQSIESSFPAFQATKEKIPGEFKVVRLEKAPPSVDPSAVSLILPRKGSSGAFVEPTGNGGECCILFSGKGDSPILRESENVTAIVEALAEAFPQWDGFYDTISEQLAAQPRTTSASTVVCNTFNFGGKAVVVGDAAHATGGVSGQGVNSALVDSVVLAECIRNSKNNLPNALLQYSLRQVPEAKALYDLSFGPKLKGFNGIIWAIKNARDTLFRGRFGIGRPPLQTRLTTDLIPFSELRKESDSFYDESFPLESQWQKQLTELHRLGC